jgi:two-component system, sensor histidine kinase PdtaS
MLGLNLSQLTLPKPSPLLFLFLFSFSVSFAQVDSLLLKLKGEKVDTTQINLLNQIAQFYQNTNTELAFDYIKQAEALALEVKFSKGYCNSCNIHGGIYFVKSEYNEAEEKFNNALECFAQVGDKESQARVQMNLGMVYDAQGRFNDSYEAYIKGLKITEETGSKENIYNACFSLGNFHLKHNKIEYARKYLLKAYEIAKELGNKKYIVRCLNNIGNLYIDEKKYTEALNYFFQAVELNKEMGLKRGIAFNYGSIANVYSAQKNYRIALKFFLEARAIFQELGEQKHVLIANYNIGNMYFDQNQFSEAIEYLRLAQEGALKIQSNELNLQVSKKLSEAFSKKGEYFQAYQNLLAKDSVREILESDRNQQIVEELERKFENEKKEKELALLKQEATGLQLKKQEQENLRNYLIMGIMLLGGTGLYLGRVARQKSKISKLLSQAVKERTAELEVQNEKTVLLLKEVHHRVKNNLQLISSLLNLHLYYEPDISAEGLVEKWKDKIKCMAIIHDKLNNANQLEQISSKEYFEELIKHIFAAFSAGNIEFIKDIESHPLDIDTLIPCGLIFNEIVSNSLKHNFKDGSQGIISISFKKNNGNYSLLIADNGKGIPEGINFKEINSLGLSLVHDLTQQLNGSIFFENFYGTRVSINFPA